MESKYFHYYNFNGVYRYEYEKNLNVVMDYIRENQDFYDLNIDEDDDYFYISSDSGCDTFFLPKKGRLFNHYCNTNRYPYDRIIEYCLHYLSKNVPGFFAYHDE